MAVESEGEDPLVVEFEGEGFWVLVWMRGPTAYRVWRFRIIAGRIWERGVIAVIGRM